MSRGVALKVVNPGASRLSFGDLRAESTTAMRQRSNGGGITITAASDVHRRPGDLKAL